MEKEEFIKLLPKLIRDDDEVKGAIISALSEVVSTKKDIEKVIEEFDKRFEAMDKRFEAMDKRFETLIEQMNKGFEEAKQDRNSLRTFIATINTRSGSRLENLILEMLDDELIQENIHRANISKVDLIDSQGDIYYESYTTDIDVVVQDGKILLIEVKSSADNRDINDLLKKAKLYKLQYNKEYNELVLVCLEISRFNFKQALEQNVKVIAGKIT